MTDTIQAKLAYLTEPFKGVYVINIQFENGAFMRVEVSKAQLGNILVDGTAMALQERLPELPPPEDIRGLHAEMATEDRRFTGNKLST